MNANVVFDLAEAGFRSDGIGISMIGIAVAALTEVVLRRPAVAAMDGARWFRAIAWSLFITCVGLLWYDWRDYRALLASYHAKRGEVVEGVLTARNTIRCDSLNGEQIVVAGRTFRLCRELDAIAFTNSGQYATELEPGRRVRLTAVGTRIVRFETLRGSG